MREEKGREWKKNNKTGLVRLRNQQKKSRVEAGSFKHCGCQLLATFCSPIAPTKHKNTKATKSDHSFAFVTLMERKIKGVMKTKTESVCLRNSEG
jgi:hypothetical protein